MSFLKWFVYILDNKSIKLQTVDNISDIHKYQDNHILVPNHCIRMSPALITPDLEGKGESGVGSRKIPVTKATSGDLPLCSVNMLEPRMRGSFGGRGLRADRMDAPLPVPRSFACWAPMATPALHPHPRHHCSHALIQ